jgi:hypothetical protein
LKWRLVLALGGSIIFAVSVSISPCLAQENAADEAREPDGAALLMKAVDGIRENYRRFPVVHCNMVLTIVSPTVKERQVIRKPTNNGGFFETTVTPRSVTEIELMLSGNSFRVDSVGQDTQERWSSTMHDEIWTTYDPARRWAGRWFRDEMPRSMNYDPRNFGVSGQNKNFLEELAGHRVVKHETEKSENGERLALQVERSIPATGVTMSYRYEFDPRRNYLPCRIVYYAPDDGKIISVLDIEYGEIARNSAWFLKKSTRCFYAEAHAETPEQGGWTQQITMDVSRVRTDETFADTAFDIEIPPGILRDNTRGRPRPPKPD